LGVDNVAEYNKGWANMKIFISWAGPQSKAMAEALRRWLPCVIQASKPWISSHDIGAGARWNLELAEKLMQTQFGIICLTPENLATISPWLLFEAGALSKFVNETNVCPYLFNLKPADVEGPLAQFQACISNKEGTWKLIESINSSLGDEKIDDGVINEVFSNFWPSLEDAIKLIPTDNEPDMTKTRSERDLLEEILDRIRKPKESPNLTPSEAIDKALHGCERNAEVDLIFRGKNRVSRIRLRPVEMTEFSNAD
jgi:hypothetical protein